MSLFWTFLDTLVVFCSINSDSIRSYSLAFCRDSLHNIFQIWKDVYFFNRLIQAIITFTKNWGHAAFLVSCIPPNLRNTTALVFWHLKLENFYTIWFLFSLIKRSCIPYHTIKNHIFYCVFYILVLLLWRFLFCDTLHRNVFSLWKKKNKLNIAISLYNQMILSTEPCPV